MPALPTGTVTLLFTDVEGSTTLLQELGRDRYVQALEAHRRLLRGAFHRHGGVEVEMQGDSFHFAFASARDAVAAAAAGQRALSGHSWESEPIRVRIGIHTGEPLSLNSLYAGLDVHRAARVMSAAHGGQVLLSQATRDLLDGDIAVRDLGEHRLKDLTAPERLYQLVAEGLAFEFPPPKTLENRPTNLPVQQTALIGRERELEEIGAMLSRGDVRLVTLTGTGGTGKTRLALHLAAASVPKFPNGVFFVSLAPISDPELVIPTIAQTLGLRERAGEPLLSTLTEHLREKQLLLLLDNFEQVIHAAPSLSSLLASTSELKLLVTSRTPLHLSGERTYDVPALSLPDPTQLPRIETLTQYEAVALFIERAQSANAGFAVTNENAPAIAEICVRLDGLPLALELAAARIRALPPQTLLGRLDQRLQLLTGGAQDLDERQRTLRGTIEWSYELLSEDEKTLFVRLSSFVGGCRLEAAEAVADPEGDLALDVLDGISSLVEQGLLRQREDSDGEARFWMLETIREYAAERLALSEAPRTQLAHANFYLALAQQAEPEFKGERQSFWLERMQSEMDNLRASLDWLLNEGHTIAAVRLAAAFGRFLERRRYIVEGREMTERVLAAAAGERFPPLMPLLNRAAAMANEQGDLKRAKRYQQESLDLARSLEDADHIAKAIGNLAILAVAAREYEEAERLCEEALILDRARGDVWDIGADYLCLGEIAICRGDYAGGAQLCEQALTLAKDRNLADLALYSRLTRAFAFVGLGEYDAAQALLHRSAELARDLRDPVGSIHTLLGLGAVAFEKGDAPRALRLIAAFHQLLEEAQVALQGCSRELYERTLPRLRSRLQKDRFAEGWEEGSALTLDEAIAFASGQEFARLHLSPAQHPG